jgi:putative oxidoreductase
MSTERIDDPTRLSSGASASRLRRILEGPIVQVGCRLLLAGVFFYAAIPKIADPAAFAVDIANYRILPGGAVHALAVTLPWIELVVAVLLVLGFWTRAAAILSGLMLLVFIASMASAVVRGLDIDCGCFGSSGDSEALGWGTVARDFFFVLPAIVVAGWDRGRYGLQALWEKD